MSYDNISYKSWDKIYKAIGAPSVDGSEKEWNDYFSYTTCRFRFQFTEAEAEPEDGDDKEIYLNCIFDTHDEGIYECDDIKLNNSGIYENVNFVSYKGNYTDFDECIDKYECGNLVKYYELKTGRKFPYSLYSGVCYTRGGFTGWNWIYVEEEEEESEEESEEKKEKE